MHIAHIKQIYFYSNVITENNGFMFGRSKRVFNAVDWMCLVFIDNIVGKGSNGIMWRKKQRRGNI